MLVKNRKELDVGAVSGKEISMSFAHKLQTTWKKQKELEFPLIETQYPDRLAHI